MHNAFSGFHPGGRTAFRGTPFGRLRRPAFRPLPSSSASSLCDNLLPTGPSPYPCPGVDTSSGGCSAVPAPKCANQRAQTSVHLRTACRSRSGALFKNIKGGNAPPSSVESLSTPLIPAPNRHQGRERPPGAPIRHFRSPDDFDYSWISLPRTSKKAPFSRSHRIIYDAWQKSISAE